MGRKSIEPRLGDSMKKKKEVWYCSDCELEDWCKANNKLKPNCKKYEENIGVPQY